MGKEKTHRNEKNLLLQKDIMQLVESNSMIHTGTLTTACTSHKVMLILEYCLYTTVVHNKREIDRIILH